MNINIAGRGQPGTARGTPVQPQFMGRGMIRPGMMNPQMRLQQPQMNFQFQQRPQQPQQPKAPRDRAQPVGKWAHLTPNNTIYVNNLNEKLKRDELVQSLRHVFGQFGKILEITCYTKILKAKGQAFIIFDKVESAQKALKEMQNFMFYNKPLRVAYAKTKSDVIAKRDGVFEERQKRPRKEKKTEGQPPTKKQQVQMPSAPKSNMLVVSNLPKEANMTMVKMLFRKYPGFQNVSDTANGKCYVTFDSEFNATRAMTGMQGFKFFNQRELTLDYAQPPAVIQTSSAQVKKE